MDLSALFPVVYAAVNWMVDPQTAPPILAAVMAGILGIRAEAALARSVKGTVKYLRSLTTQPDVNHDLERGVRLAYLNATLELIEAANKGLPAGQGFLSGTERDTAATQLKLLTKAIKDERDGLDKRIPARNIAQRQPGLLLATEEDSPVSKFHKNLRQDLYDDIRRWLPDHPKPPLGIKECLQKGWTIDTATEKGVQRTWYGSMAIFFMEQLKDTEDVRNIRLQKIFDAKEITDLQRKADRLLAVATKNLSLSTKTHKVVKDTQRRVRRMEKVLVNRPAAESTALHQPPPPPADFTGREEELKELREAIEKGGVNISGLLGQGGVGKTALALKLAEGLTPKFPGGQIYLDLKGVSKEASEKSLTWQDAMAHVIHAFDLQEKLPEGDKKLTARYHSVLHGKRALSGSAKLTSQNWCSGVDPFR